jgi:hypothetical protein
VQCDASVFLPSLTHPGTQIWYPLAGQAASKPYKRLYGLIFYDMSPSESPQFLSQRDQAPTSTFFPVSDSFNSLSSKLTSSDKLSELPVATPNRIMRSQNARAIRRSLDSLPPSSSGDSAPSPRITQAWSTIPARSSLDTPQQRVSFENDTPQGRSFSC